MLQSIGKRISLILAIFTVLGIWSCQKELDYDYVTPNDQPADLSTRINSSVSGFVTDENDAAVQGASVKFGASSTTTDEYGFFSFTDVNVVKNAAMVTVTKPGYFKGIKTYIATAGKSAFFRIKLLPKTTAGTFVASPGGSVTLSNGMTITFPTEAIVNASNNVTYAGPVNVAVQWINPTASDLNSIMPGDLRGIDANGALKILTTYGMAAVEMTGTSGELLQIAPGKKATISFPIPASLNGAAPASLPLWYFDENIGLWKEEGSATKTGNKYVGEVSHFSFWNCDVPNNYVQFDCTVVDADMIPIPYALVKISVVSSPNSCGYGWTDTSGYVHGAVPNNQQLKLEVFTNYYCGVPIYTQTFSTTNTSVSLGNIVVNAGNLHLANVTGSVTNCTGGAVSNGYIIMLNNNQYYRYNLSSSGTYDFNTIICNATEPVTFIAEDISSMQQSTPYNYSLVAGNNVIPALQACGTNTNQFFNYTINGTNYSMTSPVDSFMYYVNLQSNPAQVVISGSSFTQSGGSTSNRYMTIGFDQTGIAAGSSQTMNLFYSSDIVDSTLFNSPILVNITEYGNVGEFVSGNFSGNMTGAAPLNTPYVVSGSFRVRRSQ